MSALPDNSNHTGSSACDVCATIEAMAAMSAGPYATALAAARRTSIITTNTFMFQPVANVSAASSYFAGPRLTSTSPVQGTDQIRHGPQNGRAGLSWFESGTSIHCEAYGRVHRPKTATDPGGSW